MKFIFVLALLFCCCLAFSQRPHKLVVKGDYKLPPDETIYQDTSLVHFLYRLQRAVDLRDKTYLFSAMDKNIRFKLDKPEVGIENLKKKWSTPPWNVTLWAIIGRLLQLGGTYAVYNDRNQPEGIILPYIYAMELPDTAINKKSVLAVTGSKVRVRSRPDSYSKIIENLSYDVVFWDYRKTGGNYRDQEWIYVETKNKKVAGYVHRDYLYSPLDFRAFVNKVNGKWKITTLTAGE